MKFYLTILLLTVTLFISCTKDTGMTITKPGSDLILDKMQSGKWSSAKITDGGKKLSISGSKNGNDGNYIFDSPLLGLGGIYSDNNGDYILTVPFGKDLGIVHMNKSAKDAVDKILDILDDNGGETVLGNLISSVTSGGGSIDLSNVDKMLEGTNFPPDKRKEVEDILMSSSGGFTKGEVIN